MFEQILLDSKKNIRLAHCMALRLGYSCTAPLSSPPFNACAVSSHDLLVVQMIVNFKSFLRRKKLISAVLEDKKELKIIRKDKEECLRIRKL